MYSPQRKLAYFSIATEEGCIQTSVNCNALFLSSITLQSYFSEFWYWSEYNLWWLASHCKAVSCYIPSKLVSQPPPAAVHNLVSLSSPFSLWSNSLVYWDANLHKDYRVTAINIQSGWDTFSWG